MEKILNVKELLGDLTQGLFIERPNRFVGLISVDREIFKAHISDTGRLKELLVPGARTLLAGNPKGRLDYKLIAVEKDDEWVFLNTSLHSKIAEEVIRKGFLGFIPSKIEKEVRWGKSRIDFRVNSNFYIEIKGCNLSENDICLFPDAPTERGRKHLVELIELKQRGFRTAVMFLVFRKCRCFRPNKLEDPAFSKTFEKALQIGVKFFAFKLSFCPENGWIYLKERIKLC
ncbi:DNA/RNA nuclease SfsA [Desulfurobacterium crinifex]